jgi:hypothetical protein
LRVGGRLYRRVGGGIVRLRSRRRDETRKNEEQQGNFQRVITNTSHAQKTHEDDFGSIVMMSAFALQHSA